MSSWTIPVPPNIGSLLIDEFNIVVVDSVLILQNKLPSIFGIIIKDNLYYFCDHCGQGYSSILSLWSY